MKLKKKWMAIVLMVSMILTMLPMKAFAAQTTTKEVYIDLVEQGTENLFEGAELNSAYYAHSQEAVAVPFEKVAEGRWALTIDVENYTEDFVICDFTFPDGYRQVGYDVEPLGDWVSRWAERETSYVVEVCSKENGYGTSNVTIFDEEYSFFDGTEISVTLYKDADDIATETVKLQETTTGRLTFDYEYQNGMFIYEGEEYKDLLIYVDFPFGYTACGNRVDNYSGMPYWYTAETLAGRTIIDICAEQYLDDLTDTTKDVYVEFVDGKTGNSFADIEVLNAYYIDTNTHEHNEAMLSKEGDGVFKLSLDGKTYQNQTIWMYFECPEGYVFEGLEDTIWSDCVDRWFINGEKVTIKVCEEVYETEPMEETFTYEFVDVNGLGVVPGTNVVISLCNEMELNDKVVIAETTTGEGTFTVSHMGDFYYYDDETYNYLEISYRFPEGYILADSEGVTENTVWYSVENLCDGSNEITWFLEEVITEPETPIEPEVPVEPETPSIPEVDSDKLGEETIEQIEKDEDNHVEVVAPDSNKIDKDVFESMGKHDKDLTIGVKDKKNGKVKYSWTFSNKEMKNRDMEIDLNIRIADDKKHHIKNHVGDEDMLCIEFAHHGELPGPATIRNYVGDTYKDGHKVWLYYYDEEKNKIFRIGGKPLEVKDGYIEFTITHCSTYFVMNENLTNVEKDETSLADASLSVLDNEFDRTLASNETDSTVPKTGDKSLMGVYITTLFLGMTLLLTGKKHKKLS